jgi:CheY-like chemotaxis protein
MIEPLEFVPAAGAPLPTAQLRVLVVEDGKNVAEILAMFFELEGMKTAIALDGVEAVATAESFDLAMPRMDGFEAARRIRKLLPNVVIVALCGSSGDDVKQRAQAAGFDHHLLKPVTPDNLRRMIRHCIPLTGIRALRLEDPS